VHKPEELRYLILAAQREGNRILGDLLRPAGLTPSQAEVLRVLAEHGPMALMDLGARLVCENGSPSRLVDELVAAGLVARAPAADDRRRVRLSLTSTGRDSAQLAHTVEQQLHDLIAGLIPPQDLEVANRVLWRLVTGRPAGEALATRIADTPKPT